MGIGNLLGTKGSKALLVALAGSVAVLSSAAAFADGTAVTVSLAQSSTESLLNTKTTYTVTVKVPNSSTIPTGQVEFVNNSVVEQTVQLDATGQAKWAPTTNAAGGHVMSAHYVPAAGSAFATGYSQRIFHYVYTATQTTMTKAALSEDHTETIELMPVTFTVVVTPTVAGGGTPTGVVNFWGDGDLRETFPLDASGKATWLTNRIIPGVHKIWATYEPTAGSKFAGSAATSITFTVNKK